jgi:predicted ATP-grasp superfamily ATP-dependent carboligase
LRGAAGRGICIWEGGGSEHATLDEPHYFQERRRGVPISGLFLAVPGKTTLLGITRQLVGVQEVHAPPFAWCGTIVPVETPVETTSMIDRIGAVLAQDAGLRGLFGCDFILDDDKPWLTEVNPRYPASTELFEHVLHAPLLGWHRRACEGADDFQRLFGMPTAGDMTARLSAMRSATGPGGAVVGKIVLYASRDVVAADCMRFVQRPRLHAIESHEFGALPYLADIAAPGARIARGQPICTLFARAASESECLGKLVRRAARFEARSVSK